MDLDQTYILGMLVEHKPGVLQKVSSMFRRRQFNIESISVGPTDQQGLARMTITVNGDERVVEQMIKQMRKLIDVVRVVRLDPSNTVIREMALVKVHTSDARARSDIINYANIFRARVVDVSSETIMVEITGDSDKTNAFLELMKSFGVEEIARTGITALSRGAKSVRME